MNIAIVHEMPGSPPVLMWWHDGEVERKELTDKEALQVAADLVKAVVINKGTER